VKALRIEIKKAEVELKRSKTKDYYKILGVSREATDAELKKAYRRESLLHHPDKVGGCVTPLLGYMSRRSRPRTTQGGDEEKFKLVAESWAVLSDPQRRQRYDLGEEDGQSSGMGGGMDGMDLSELFAQFHGGGGMHGGHGHPGMGGGFGGGFPGGRPGGRSSFRSGGPAGFGF
jgi:DnaJ family protein C protein 7